MAHPFLIAALVWSALTVSQERGREIYRHGTLAGSAVGTASIGKDGTPLPSSSFACANCHGTWGEGGREGGIEPPPLNWKRLVSAGVSPVTGRRRPAYTAETLARAITEGTDPGGVSLHEGMPRYRMSNEHFAELLDYLKHIGEEDDTDTGVTADSIRIGAALPLSGPLEGAGKGIQATLEQLFAEASRNGAIYGRRVELVVEDSRGEPAGFLEATRRLIANDQVFAMAASLPLDDGDDSNNLLEASGVSLIGPIVQSPRAQSSIPSNVFYLLPSLYDQARAFVDFIASRNAPRLPRLAVISGGTRFDQEVSEGIRSQAGIHGFETVIAKGNSSNEFSAIFAAGPDYVLFLGDTAGLVRIAGELDQKRGPIILVGFLALCQRGINLLPPEVARQTLFVGPASPPDTLQSSEFLSPVQNPLKTADYVGLRAMAFAAGKVLLQALRSTGNRPTREGLAHALETLRRFETGATPPVTFAPNQRVGSSGAIMLRFDPVRREFESVSGWITPKM